MTQQWNRQRAKKKILAHLYTENLKVVGKGPRQKPMPFRVRPWVLGLVVFLAVTAYLNTSTQYLGQITGDARIQQQETISSAPKPIATQPQQDMDPQRAAEYHSLLTSKSAPLTKMFGLNVKHIIIDAGHGGDDPGAVGKTGTLEKDITLDIANSLRDSLRQHQGLHVSMTREEDRFVSLKDRADMANKKGADLFVSVHVNYLPKRTLDIIETYYFGASKDRDALMLAEKENVGSGFSLSEYNHIIKRINDTLKLQESSLIASSIQRNLYANMKTVNNDVKDYGVKRAPFVVLLGTEMPSVLVEVACLSNAEEEARLRDPQYRKDIAKYIEEGILQYISSRGEN